MEIGRVPAAMALGALEGRIVRAGARGIRVASGADTACIAVIDIPPSVSKRRPQPT